MQDEIGPENAPGGRIFVSGPTTLFKTTGIPPIAIDLPQNYRARKRWIFLWLASLPLSILLAVVSFVEFFYILNTRSLFDNISLSQLLVYITLVIGFLGCCDVAVWTFREILCALTINGPILTVSNIGILDRRVSPDWIKWSDLLDASHYAGIRGSEGGVALTINPDFAIRLKTIESGYSWLRARLRGRNCQIRISTKGFPEHKIGAQRLILELAKVNNVPTKHRLARR